MRTCTACPHTWLLPEISLWRADLISFRWEEQGQGHEKDFIPYVLKNLLQHIIGARQLEGTDPFGDQVGLGLRTCDEHPF